MSVAFQAKAALLQPNPFADRPQVSFEPVQVYVFETRTGRVISTVPFQGNPRWNNGVNVSPVWSIDVKLRGKADDGGLAPLDLEGITNPWRYSWAIAQGAKVWEAGPCIGESHGGDSATTITGGGLWKLLTDKRLLINPARANVRDVTSTDADLNFGPSGWVPVSGGPVLAGNRDLSLHTIAKRIVQIIATSAPGGELPIAYPDDIAGDAQREYPGYDMASPGSRLTQLTQVENGPEVQFLPEFVDPITRQSIRWRMVIGNPHIGNLEWSHAFDQGKALVQVSNYDTDGGQVSTRDWELGNGMNRDLITGYANAALNPADPGAILLESSGRDHTSATERATLDSWAANTVATSGVPIPSMTVVVRTAGDDGNGNKTRSPHQAEVFCGDNATFELRDDIRHPDGTYYGRIAGRASGSTPDTQVLTIQLLGRDLR